MTDSWRAVKAKPEERVTTTYLVLRFHRVPIGKTPRIWRHRSHAPEAHPWHGAHCSYDNKHYAHDDDNLKQSREQLMSSAFRFFSLWRRWQTVVSPVFPLCAWLRKCVVPPEHLRSEVSFLRTCNIRNLISAYISHSPCDAWNISPAVCRHNCEIACALKETFAQCKLFLEGTRGLTFAFKACMMGCWKRNNWKN